MQDKVKGDSAVGILMKIPARSCKRKKRKKKERKKKTPNPVPSIRQIDNVFFHSISNLNSGTGPPTSSLALPQVPLYIKHMP